MTLTDINIPELFRTLDLLGVLLNGILGGMVAREHRFDIIGFTALAITSALGGGMVRDILLQSGPPLAIADPWYITTAVIAAAIAYAIPPRGRFWNYGSAILDGLVLGAWAATGTIKTVSLGFAWPPALLLGVMTAVGGSAIRDISVGRIPAVFGGHYLYATPALLASVIALFFANADLPNLGMLAATLIGCAFALFARWRKWTLPMAGEDTRISLTPEQIRKLVRVSIRRGEHRARKRMKDAGQRVEDEDDDADLTDSPTDL